MNSAWIVLPTTWWLSPLTIEHYQQVEIQNCLLIQQQTLLFWNCCEMFMHCISAGESYPLSFVWSHDISHFRNCRINLCIRQSFFISMLLDFRLIPCMILILSLGCAFSLKWLNMDDMLRFVFASKLYCSNINLIIIKTIFVRSKAKLTFVLIKPIPCSPYVVYKQFVSGVLCCFIKYGH